MIAIIASARDEASSNIADHLVRIGNWESIGRFGGKEVLRQDDRILVWIADEHLYHDNLDLQLKEELGLELERVIFLSRHSSESGMRSLTVHPLGNYADADYGGRPRTLVPSAPHLMTSTLRNLKKEARGLDFSVSYEATHHGPYLSTPTLFVEIGSDQEAWRDLRAGKAIARAVWAAGTTVDPVAIGIGGGHYAPRISDVALRRRVSFGHIVPTYALRRDMDSIRLAAEATPKASIAYIHRKALKAEERREATRMLADLGLEVVREAGLEPL